MNIRKLGLIFLFLFIISNIKISFSYTQNEKRAIWYNPLDVLPKNYTEAKIKLWDDFRLYQKLNITDVFVLAKENYALYNSSIAPMHPDYSFDILNESCQIADQLNISVHAWIDVMRNHHLIAENSSLAMVDFYGNSSWDWINPVIPECKSYILNIINEIITNYDVKGIQLDYIRYPDNTYSYDNYSRQLFNETYGFDPLDNPEAPEWTYWRCEQITNLTKEAKIIIKSFNPNIQISSAIFPDIASISNLFQNTTDWNNLHLMDFFCPMIYTDSTSEFENSVKNFTLRIAKKTDVLIGTGIYLYAEDPNRKEIFLNQINITKRYDAQGFILFRDKYLDPFIEYFSELGNLIQKENDQPQWYQDPYVFGIVIMAIVVCIYIWQKF
jgi:uncharacterized lipoprotein YddW (UPF0748 family)